MRNPLKYFQNVTKFYWNPPDLPKINVSRSGNEVPKGDTVREGTDNIHKREGIMSVDVYGFRFTFTWTKKLLKFNWKW